MKLVEVESRFKYHRNCGEQAQKYDFIRRNIVFLTIEIDKLIPDCKEKEIVITKLEEAAMWSREAVAKHDET